MGGERKRIRWRIVVLAWPFVFGLIYLVGSIVAFIFPKAPEALTIAISSFLICSAMIYAVVPFISSVFNSWITKNEK